MATTTPSFFGDKLSYAIRYGPLDELVPLLQQAAQNPPDLDTSDYSLRLLLSTPLQATTRPEAYRCNVFMLLLAAGCDPDRRGADGSRVEWEIDGLGAEARRIVLAELKEARACKAEGISYGIPSEAEEWVREELVIVAELREIEQKRVERERKMIFMELDREMEEFEASFRPPPEVAQYEVPEDELMDYEQVVEDKPPTAASPPPQISAGSTATIQPTQLSASASLPPTSEHQAATPMEQDFQKSAPTKACDQSSPPQVASLSRLSRHVQTTSKMAPIASSVFPSSLGLTSPSLATSSIPPFQASSNPLPSSITALESPQTVSPMSISPGVSPLSSVNTAKPSSLPEATSLAPPSNPSIPPPTLPVTDSTAKPYVSPAAALAPKFIAAKPAPGQIGFSLNRLPPRRTASSALPGASSSPSTVKDPLTTTPLVESTSSRSPPRSSSTTASETVVTAPSLESASSPALPPSSQVQSRENSQSVDSSSSSSALVANESPQSETQPATSTTQMTNTSLKNIRQAAAQAKAGLAKPKRSRLPSSMKSRLSSISNGTASIDSSRTTSISNDSKPTPTSARAPELGGGETSAPTSATPSSASPSGLNSQYNESSRSRLPPRRPSTQTSSSQQYTVMFRKLPDFVTPSILKHFLTHGPSSFDSIKLASEVFHLDSLIELGSVKVPEENSLSLPAPREVKCWDFEGGSGRAQKRGSALYGSEEEAQKVKELFDGKKLVEAGVAGGIEIFVVSNGNAKENENRNGDGFHSPRPTSPTPDYHQSSRSCLPSKVPTGSQPLGGGGGGIANYNDTSADPSQLKQQTAPQTIPHSVAIDNPPSHSPAPIAREPAIAIFTKLPPIITANSFKHYLTWGPQAYDGVTMEQLRDLDRLLDAGIVLPPFETTLSEPPPVPGQVKIYETDLNSRGAEVVYDHKSDLRKVYKLFGGRKMFPCLNGGGIGVKI
ncbi:hypothetical protein JCM5350_006796 [Sporobolomyces pararoseus]